MKKKLAEIAPRRYRTWPPAVDDLIDELTGLRARSASARVFESRGAKRGKL